MMHSTYSATYSSSTRTSVWVLNKPWGIRTLRNSTIRKTNQSAREGLTSLLMTIKSSQLENTGTNFTLIFTKGRRNCARRSCSRTTTSSSTRIRVLHKAIPNRTATTTCERWTTCCKACETTNSLLLADRGISKRELRQSFGALSAGNVCAMLGYYAQTDINDRSKEFDFSTASRKSVKEAKLEKMSMTFNSRHN